jgi:ribonuclease D
VRGLAIARELWQARDDYARETDIAPGRLVPDAALVAAARTPPATKRDLAAMKEFTGRASRSQLDRWWAAIEAGQTTTDLPVLRVTTETIPPPRAWADKNPEADARLKAARLVMGELSDELSIPVENLLTPELLRRLAWTPPQPIVTDAVAKALEDAGARPWQVSAVAEPITLAFVASAEADPEGFVDQGQTIPTDSEPDS